MMSLQISYAGHVQALTATAAGAVGGATTIPIAAAPALGGFSYPAGATPGRHRARDEHDRLAHKLLRRQDPAATTFNFNSDGREPVLQLGLMYVQEITGREQLLLVRQGLDSQQLRLHRGRSRQVHRADQRHDVRHPHRCDGVDSVERGRDADGNIKNNDTITVTQGPHVQTFTANGAQTFGASSIVVNRPEQPPTAFTQVPSSPTRSAQTSLDQNASTDTVSQFQTAHHLAAGKLVMYPLTGSGPSGRDQSGNPFLPHGSSRTFYVGLYLPLVGASNQNALQGLSSTFGLTWHIDQ